MVVVLDEVAPVAGVACADRCHAWGTQVDGIDVVRAGDVPRSKTVGVGRTGVKEAIVARLNLSHE